MTIYRGPGGTGTATSDSDLTEFQNFVDQAEAARDLAVAAQTAAELAETHAETAETNAETAETNAETAATNAATSETNAASSASSASGSASAASTSATSAASSASNASSSASAASTSASSASTSATSAASSASTATTQASNASTSATNAATSASAASTSASNASSSATAAASSATSASSSASSAASSASAASTSASNAASSATSAASSATAAAASAASIDPATLVKLTGDQTIAGVKTFSSNPILSGGTANGVTYLNGSKVLTSGSALTFDGTNFGGGVNVLVSDNKAIGFGSNAYWLGNSASGFIAGYINGSEGMRLTSTGLGIGTPSPIYRLTVVGATSDATPVANFRSYTTGTDGARTAVVRYSSSTDSNWANARHDAYNHFWYGNGSEIARLTYNGNLLVGTTSAGAMITAKTQTASGSALATLGTSGDTSFQSILVTKFDNNSTTSQNFIQFQINNGGANCGRITANGANTAAFGSTSDQRVKENIIDLPSQLANIMSLRPVEYDYIESYGSGHQIGFIAQEMQQIYPDVISQDDSEEKILSITGWSKTEARLVKAIQEQQALINAQQAALQTLTARVAALESN